MSIEIELRPGKAPRAVIDSVYVVVIDGEDVFESARRPVAEAFAAGYRLAQEVKA